MNIRRLLLPATLGVAGYFALFGGEHNAFEAWSMERQRQREVSELARVRGEVDRLRVRADSLEHDTETLERLARERFGMIREGERLYRFGDPDGDSVAPPPAPR